jgi:predicted enzyme related to lactoylglutathione lyase
MARAVAFYEDGLGMAKTDFAESYWVEFDVDGVAFGIGNFEQTGTPGTAQSLALEIADLVAYRAALTSRGIESTEPHELPICWISTVRDPDGNTLYLHQSKPR